MRVQLICAIAMGLFLGTALPAAEPFGLVPEAERGLKASVMGLDPADGEYFGLPQFDPAVARKHGWDRQLYWLDFELSHGCLMRVLPSWTRIFIANPSGAKGSRHNEEAFFKQYLRDRAGWDAARIASQISFFHVDDPLIWAQDFALQAGLGPGPTAQRLLYVGPDDADVYRHFAEHLVAQAPDTFSKRSLPKGVSGEGGDLALARFADGKIGLLVGRHRVEHYLKARGLSWAPGQVVSPQTVAEVENAYAKAFGVRAVIVPKAPLLEGWGTEELFHLDMLAAFLGPKVSYAVVPQMTRAPRDHSTGKPLDPDLVKDLNREFAAVAKELQAAGFQVRRAPLDDHPARSPTNSIKYESHHANERAVLLARYASADDMASGGLRQALDRLNSLAGDVHQHPSDGQVAEINQAIAAVWQAMTVCNLSPNPLFDAQAAAYRDSGYKVVPVPDYPWGAGSLHCQFMH